MKIHPDIARRLEAIKRHPGKLKQAQGEYQSLNVGERADLKRCEAAVTKHRLTFIEVGEALQEIREKRLYRESHKTFADYIKDRWKMDRSRAYQLINAAETSTFVDIPNESVARELTSVAPEQRAEVIQRTRTDYGKVTASAVRNVVHRQNVNAEAAALRNETIDMIRELVRLFGRIGERQAEAASPHFNALLEIARGN